jgi:hypothetical protein
VRHSAAPLITIARPPRTIVAIATFLMQAHGTWAGDRDSLRRSDAPVVTATRSCPASRPSYDWVGTIASGGRGGRSG